jgi:hypothetical protein
MSAIFSHMSEKCSFMSIKVFPDVKSENLSRVVHNYVVERGWSGANEHYTQ